MAGWFPLLGPAPAADIFVFAGQSNATTNVTTLAGVPAYITSDVNVQMWNYDTSAFVTYGAGTNSLQPTTQVDSGGGVAGNWGAEAEFTYRWRLANPTKKAFLVKYAIGGTSLFAQVGVNDWSETSTAEYFSRVETAIVSAKAAITALGLVPVVRMISWTQGEADAGNATWDAAYLTNLQNVVAAMRTRWGDANTQIIIGRIIPGWAFNPNVRPAQVTVGNAGALNKWLNADLYATTSNHYNDSGASQFGKDTFYAYANGHTEKVTNGTFNTDISGWSGVTYNGSISVPDNSGISWAAPGIIQTTNVAGHTVAGAVQQITGLIVGATYKIAATITRNDTANYRVSVTTDSLGQGSNGSGAFVYNTGQVAGTGTIDGSFLATATSHYVALFNQSFSLGTVSFDNVSVIGP